MVDEDKLRIAFNFVELYEAFMDTWEQEHTEEDPPDFHDFMQWLTHETNKAGALIHIPTPPEPKEPEEQPSDPNA